MAHRSTAKTSSIASAARPAPVPSMAGAGAMPPSPPMPMPPKPPPPEGGGTPKPPPKPLPKPLPKFPALPKPPSWPPWLPGPVSAAVFYLMVRFSRARVARVPGRTSPQKTVQHYIMTYYNYIILYTYLKLLYDAEISIRGAT